MRPADEIKRLVKDAKVIIDPAVKRDALRELIDELEKPETIRSAKTKPNMWRIIMNSRTIKLAATAVIIIAVLLGLPFLSKSTTSPTLAEILAKVEQTKAYTYKIKMKVTGSVMPDISPWGEDMTGTITVSEEFGIKTEMKMTDPDTGKITTQESYIIPDEKLFVELMHEKKRFSRTEFSDDLLARMKKQNNDPRELIRQMLGLKYTELGKSEIDGVEVDGFETTDPRASGGTTGDFKATLWVDSKSWLPVLVEMDMSINEQARIRSTYSDYQWDVPVQKDAFVPVIPDDYEAMPGDGMKWPEMTEEAAIKGLKLVADLVGRYPKKASIVDLMQELSPIMFKRIKKNSPEDMTETELETKMMEAIQPVYPIGLFYMALVEDKKEPFYYGQTVGPDDVEAVLLRWKISDDQYRVILGDLRTMDVTAEKLAELEN
jgi:outer membrane lipoprotein-sorting protein